MDRFSHHVGQISLVGFCIFGKSPEATEGSRGFMEYTSKSSIGGIYFPNVGRVHEGSQGSREWYMDPKNDDFVCLALIQVLAFSGTICPATKTHKKHGEQRRG